MVRKTILCIIMTIIASLAFLGTVSSRGPETSTISLDTIKSEVASSLDLGNSNVEQTAVTIAKDYPGEYNINQVSEIFKTLRKGWFYFSDPSYKNRYKHANRTLQDGKMSNTIGMGNCDDFAILMASLIVSLGGSTKITFAQNSTNPEGHAYCEVFLGNENDPQVNDLINWTASDYNIGEVPGLNKTGNEVWMNLDWSADNPGGPYFKGDERMVVWQSDKLISPKIVPVIDTMDSTAGWTILKDDKGSNISIASYPARKGLGIVISYDLKESGWVGIAKNVSPELLAQVEGLNFSCYATDRQNAVEMRLVYGNGTEWAYSWSPDLGKWVYLEGLFSDFKFIRYAKYLSSTNEILDPNNVKKLEFLISDQQDKAGPGRVELDHIQGVMNIPAGSPWAKVEEELNASLANRLASQSVLNREIRLDTSVLLGIESLRLHYTPAGYKALCQALTLLPKHVTRMKHNDSVVDVCFSPDGKEVATASLDNSACIWNALTGKEQAKLNHDGDVNAVAFSLDGSRLATGSRDNTIRLWNALTGKELGRMNTTSNVKMVSFSPDGKLLVAVDDDDICILDPLTLKKLKAIIPPAIVADFSFSPDGRQLATVSRDNTSCVGNIARVWDLSTAKLLMSLNISFNVNAVSFSPDGHQLATACDDKMVHIWNASTGRELMRLKHDDWVYDVYFSPDGSHLATRSKDKTIRIWDASTGRELTKITLNDWTNDLCFSPDGTCLAAAGDDGVARLWEVSTGKILKRMEHTDSVIAISFSPDGTQLATASLDNTACVWDISIVQELVRMNHRDDVKSEFFSPDGKLLATTSRFNISLWATSTGKNLPWLDPNNKGVKIVSFSPDGTCLATTTYWGKEVRILNTSTGKELAKIRHDGLVNAISFSPDGKRLATSSDDNTAYISDASDGEELVRINHKYVDTISFSPDGTRLVTASGFNTRLWNSSTGKEQASKNYSSNVIAVYFSCDGAHLVTVCGSNTAYLLEASTGRELARMDHHYYQIGPVSFSLDGSKLATTVGNNIRISNTSTGKGIINISSDHNVNAVAFSPDGTRLATGSDDGTARIWDAISGDELSRMNHNGPVNAISFSPDGTYLASASYDNTARLFDASTGEELMIMDHDGPVNDVCFSPDGSRLATASKDNTARIWYFRPVELIKDGCSRLNHGISQKDWQRYMGNEPFCEICPET